ncbi:MAG: Coenzyme F420 hydrogenase/dehydrogenase, beta subunit C-terminal domain [Duncaniella sp.]|nr:Coenzyme F420 hydrogenase/dehydrogenase, beta subunit C-terminal domain [Duncaniella sp.]
MFFNGLTPQPEKCCGCEGCRSICPKAAISMTTDKDGFVMPEVNSELCIECGLCEKVCPMFHSAKVISAEPGKAYAAVSKNDDILAESSSGGIFSIIADYVLKNGGVVSGASFDDNLRLNHTIVTDSDGIEKLRGSKYLQSITGDIYTRIRDILKSGKMVYFVGTGCQVAGLKLFLRKEYDNLITSDILCHGVPPQAVFDEMIRVVESKYGGKIIKYSFRDKSVWGWSCNSSSLIKKGNRLLYRGNEPMQQAYFNAFIKGDNYRESCYKCPYAQSRRPGDITLGDYWGVEHYISIPDTRKGVSALMINTPKGESLWSIISGNADTYTASLEDIRQINKTLTSPTPRPEGRDMFFVRFHENPAKTLMSYYRPSKKRDLLYLLKRNPLTSKMISLIKKLSHK